MKKLLIVDDKAEVRNLLRLTLASDDHVTREADNGLDALQLIRDWRPDIVLLDIMMPGEIDGLEVCNRVKQDPALRKTIVAMLTARGQESDLQAGQAVGADAYLVKPFSPTQLITMVNRLTHPPVQERDVNHNT